MTDVTLPSAFAPAATAEPSLLRDCVAKARGGLRLAAERSMPLPEETVATVIATGRALDQGTLSAEQEERFWHAYARVCSGAMEAAALRQRYNIAFVVLLVIVLGVQSIYISTAGLIDAVKEQWAIVLDYENAQSPQCAGRSEAERAAEAARPPETGPGKLGSAPGCPTRLVTEPNYRVAQSQLKSYDHLLHSSNLLLPGLLTSNESSSGKGEQIESFQHFVKFGALTNARRFLELFLLPALYGALGACAFVLRRFTAENAQTVIHSDSGIRHGLRISIGVIAGLAIHWLTHRPEGTGGALADSLTHLSRIGMSFVAGYGSEVVFNLLDRVVAALAPGRSESEQAQSRTINTKKAAESAA